MNNNLFKTVLLVALPASGKSEVRHFMANIDPKRLEEDFHIGDNLQLDDFPYVHFMRCIDGELESLGLEPIFYPGQNPFNNNKDWGTLTQLLNEDYHDLLNRNRISMDNAAIYLFDRIDRAAGMAGLPPRLAMLDEDVRNRIAESLKDEAERILREKEAQIPESFEGKTIVIECARGGPDGSSMPLTGEYGYLYTLSQFAPDLLKDAVILYIWVTPEESRRKNNERANPDDPGSNLFHGVPLSVMLGDYGCDDMQYLRENAEVPDTITVKTFGNTYNVPIGVFDNRVDKTSFLRGDPMNWPQDKVEEMTEAVKKATDTMWANYKK
ncbi:MAG: hypothetical protein IKI61_01145 [Erysipelotrichaceae bacterium]|nr:hypothetical protein [Erysipelotrichaceae bacterium]